MDPSQSTTWKMKSPVVRLVFLEDLVSQVELVWAIPSVQLDSASLQEWQSVYVDLGCERFSIWALVRSLGNSPDLLISSSEPCRRKALLSLRCINDRIQVRSLRPNTMPLTQFSQTISISEFQLISTRETLISSCSQTINISAL